MRLTQPIESETVAEESLTRMCDAAPDAARPLADLGVRLVVFCCTSASFFKGYGWGLCQLAEISSISLAKLCRLQFTGRTSPLTM